MTTPSKSILYLHDLASGTVLAQEGLRKYQAVVEAARGVVWFDWSENDPDAVAEVDALRDVLREGGFIE